jgi:hypothetical protein
MAKLSTLRRDVATLSDGVWISPDPNLEEIEMRVRGKDATYFDVLSVKFREAVRRAREDGTLKSKQGLNDMAPSTVQAIEDRLLLERLVLDVRGIEADDGSALSVEQFREMAISEAYLPMLFLAREAVILATERRDSDRAAALGNSEASPSTGSRGAKRAA